MRVFLALVIVSAALVTAASGSAVATGYTAFVSAPPKVQTAGRSYLLTIRVRNTGRTVRPFCVDFTDDKNSWLIEMPRLYSFNSDAWCVGTLKAGVRKTLRALVTAAKPGSKKMSITLGKAQVFRATHRIIINDDNALYWERRFVIVG
jgi:hypothetical protein